jgi:hypothetical protein
VGGAWKVRQLNRRLYEMDKLVSLPMLTSAGILFLAYIGLRFINKKLFNSNPKKDNPRESMSIDEHERLCPRDEINAKLTKVHDAITVMQNNMNKRGTDG